MDQETELVLRCKAGQSEAFGQIYDLYARRIYDFLFYRVRHKQTAEDLTSQTFFKALDKISSFSPQKGSFASWLYKIARNTLIDYYRSSRDTADLENAYSLAGPDNVERGADVNLNWEKFSQSFAALENKQKEILLMRLWDGLPFARIAEILEYGESDCKATFYRTMDKLQRELLPFLVLALMLNKILSASAWRSSA